MLWLHNIALSSIVVWCELNLIFPLYAYIYGECSCYAWPILYIHNEYLNINLYKAQSNAWNYFIIKLKINWNIFICFFLWMRMAYSKSMFSLKLMHVFLWLVSFCYIYTRVYANNIYTYKWKYASTPHHKYTRFIWTRTLNVKQNFLMFAASTKLLKINISAMAGV